jgi:hypothetical protein
MVLPHLGVCSCLIVSFWHPWLWATIPLPLMDLPERLVSLVVSCSMPPQQCPLDSSSMAAGCTWLMEDLATSMHTPVTAH